MQRLGELLAEGMSRVDACPCGNTQPPDAAIPHDNGWTTHHTCADCRRTWTTEWKD